jgi:hypothetical protein
MKTLKIVLSIESLAEGLDTTVEMLISYAHSLGFDWVCETSEAYICPKTSEFAFFIRK